jgi:hypothetical protein
MPDSERQRTRSHDGISGAGFLFPSLDKTAEGKKSGIRSVEQLV